MPRKTAESFTPIEVMIQEFEAVTVLRYETATEVFEAQDKATQEAMSEILGSLHEHAETTVTLGGTKIEVDEETLKMARIVLGVELVKDLYLVGLQVANFEWDASTCIACGSEV